MSMDDFDLDAALAAAPQQQVVKYYSMGGGSSGGGGGGSRTLLAELTNSTGAEFDFDGIAQSYDRLILKAVVRSTAATAGDEMAIYLNNDVAAINYLSSVHAIFNGTGSDGEYSRSYGAYIPSAGSPADAYGELTIELESYTSGNLKMIQSEGGGLTATGVIANGQNLIASSITAPITRVRLRTDNDPIDTLIGNVQLWGEKVV